MIIIDYENLSVGNKAAASVLLLYYHLIQEDGFTNDQNVCIDPKDFNGFDFLDVQVESAGIDVDEDLLREGAIIYLLCDLDDTCQNFEDSFMSNDFTSKILDAIDGLDPISIPEAKALVAYLRAHGEAYDYPEYSKMLRAIYLKYVVGRFKQLVSV